MKAALYLKICGGTVKAEDTIRFLKELKKQLKGRKILLFWDGLPAHRAKIVKKYVEAQKDWLRIERFPAYDPEGNPIEYLWSAMKRKDLANCPPQGLPDLIRKIRASKRRLSNSNLLKGFLKASKLY